MGFLNSFIPSWGTNEDEAFVNEELPVDFEEMKTTVNNVLMRRIQNLERLGDNISHADRMEMKRDPIIRFASLLKKFAILGRGWSIKNDTASPEVAEFVQEVLEEELDGVFLERLRQILSALDHGVSITEKVWKVREDGKVVLKDLRTREDNLNTFTVNKDKYGNVVSLEQTNNPKSIPLDKVLIFTYMGSGDILSGTSDFEVAWDSWFRKRCVKEYWMAYLELRSKINIIAKYQGKDLDSPMAKKLWTLVKNMQLGGRMVIPDSVDLEYINQGQQDANLFYKATKYFDGQSSKAILVPQLMTEASGENSSAGSYALGRSHLDVFLMILNYIRNKLEEKINKEIIRPLVDYNFDVDEYPEFKIKFFEKTSKKELKDAVEMLIDKGVVKTDEGWIRDFMGVPGPQAESSEAGTSAMETMAQELEDLSHEVNNPEIDEGAEVE